MKNENIIAELKAQSEGKIVHSASDCYGNIEVIDYSQYRVMKFDSVLEQSRFYPEKPYVLAHEYTRIMALVLGFIEPHHTIILGLGGGSLLRSLHHYLYHCDFHVVELRQKVYEVAKYYFDIPNDERVSISIDDGQLHMNTSADSSTDIIFADMFNAYTMSPIQISLHFISECCRTLTDNGWLVINFHRMPNKKSIFFEKLADCFTSILICSGESGNHIFFACKAPSVDFDNASIKLKKMEKVLNQPFMQSFQRIEQIRM